MTDKVQKIKEEIERQIEEGKVKCQQSKENNDHESLVAWSEHVATCGKILLFINSLPEERIDETMKKNYNEQYSRIAQTEQFKTSYCSKSLVKEEPVSEDLEEVATKWNETASLQPFYMQLDCNGNPCEVKQDITTHKESFKAGAEWQKQQIIKDAVDATILDIDAQTVEFGLWPEKLLDIKEGDKVKIIIVKENG